VSEDGTALSASDLAFTIGTQGLLFMFSPYEVASYAEGAFFVIVPWASLGSVLRPNIAHEQFLGRERTQ